ncbi:MAG TPA: DUF2905 domain-containing protein [Bryobacteraceae bacterium]|jgi:hypothetical protein|nr:DUF2905 domain-containing protein [Bryobacteraceae bacterium]
MGGIGRSLILMGIVLVIVGAVLSFGRRLPGDIVWRGKTTTVYFPLGTCIVISIVLSLVMWLMGRLR